MEIPSHTPGYPSNCLAMWIHNEKTLALLWHLSRIFQFFNLYTTFKNWEIRLCWPMGLGCPRFSAPPWYEVLSGFSLLSDFWLQKATNSCTVGWVHGKHTTEECNGESQRLEDNSCWKLGLQTQMDWLLCVQEWAPLQQNVHAKMLLIFPVLEFIYFLLQTCIQYLQVCVPTLCAKCKMPSVM